MQRVRKAVLPVAGLGTRFLPATKAMPKEMLTVVDRPVIQHAVQEALASGIEQLIFVTGRGKTAIEDHFDHAFGSFVSFVVSCFLHIYIHFPDTNNTFYCNSFLMFIRAMACTS